jgi:hypothetical protein
MSYSITLGRIFYSDKNEWNIATWKKNHREVSPKHNV